MKIKETREAIGLTKKDVAEQLGISVNDYSLIEDEKGEPTASQLLNLADLFGVSVDYILGHSTPISKGESTWLNIRKSLPMDKLQTVAQMLNGVNDLQLTEEDINNISDVENDRLDNCGNDENMKQLFNSWDDEDELTFDDYLILKKIADGEKISFKTKDAKTFKTSYSFTYEGKFYSSNKVSKILYRLDNKFNLLGYYFVVKETKNGFVCDDDNYFSLTKKAKALLKAKEDELKRQN